MAIYEIFIYQHAFVRRCVSSPLAARVVYPFVSIFCIKVLLMLYAIKVFLCVTVCLEKYSLGKFLFNFQPKGELKILFSASEKAFAKSAR